MVKKILVTWFCLIFAMISKSQTSSFFLSKADLLRIQEKSVAEISGFISGKGWTLQSNIDSPIFDYFDCFLDYRLKKWENNSGKDWMGTLFVYYKDGIPNLILYQTTKDCFKSLQLSNPKYSNVQGYKTNIYKRNDLRFEFREFIQDSSKRKYSILIYDENSLKKLLNSEKTRIDDYNRSLKAGNDLFVDMKFKEAIYQYEIARKNIPPWDEASLIEIDNCIQNCNKKVRIELFDKYIFKGDSLIEKERFEEALANYENALRADSTDQRLNDKITRLKMRINLDRHGDQEQSYAFTNPIDYNGFKEKNYAALNELMLNVKKAGAIKYTSTILFDREGNNLSDLKINYVINSRLTRYFSDIAFDGLSPSLLFNRNIPSKEVLNFDLSWKRDNVVVRVQNQNIEIQNDEYFTFKYNQIIQQFINAQKYKNGVYKFDIIRKKLNGVNYEDLKLNSYRSNSGPMNCLYSFILPGWGAQRVSDRQKGKGTMIQFFVISAILVGGKIYSNNMYYKYQNDLNHNERSYRNADISNKLFVIAGGITAGIYLSDILYTIFRGTKNNHKSGFLKQKLKESSVFLVKSPLKP